MSGACITRLNTMTTAIPSLQAALRDNTRCQRGLLADQRMVLLHQGINSYHQDKELLVLISDQGDWWYGYVLRTGPVFPFDPTHGEWLALLVQSGVPIDGYTPEAVFRCAQKAWFRLLEYQPYFIQQPEDGMVQCHTFDQAVQALGTIIRRFDITKRIAWEWDDQGNLLDPPGKLDRRCESLFGLHYDTRLLSEA